MTSAFGAGSTGGPPTGTCPCGSRTLFVDCCRPALTGEQPARTAEALMRSRYTAYVIGDADHLFRSWHPRHRPAEIALDPAVRWVSLTVVDTVDGGEHDQDGVVEFRARYLDADGPGELRERSLFTRRAGRWVYTHAQ